MNVWDPDEYADETAHVKRARVCELTRVCVCAFLNQGGGAGILIGRPVSDQNLLFVC